MTENQVSFGTIIKQIRQDRHLTQKMLSENICSQSVLSRIENDEELPNVLVMQQLCQKLGVTIDQVMACHSYEIQKVRRLLEQMAYHFFHQEYTKLEALLVRPDVLANLYLDTDLQLYYYYLGSCQYFLHKNHEQAIRDLERGLTYTYQLNKYHISATEIQLISCIGRLYAEIGKVSEGQQLLEKSVELFYQLPEQRIDQQLAKVFYNYGLFLMQQKKYEAAKEIVKQGIVMSKKRKSYYYLAELLRLKGLIYKSMNEECQAYFKLSAMIKNFGKI